MHTLATAYGRCGTESPDGLETTIAAILARCTRDAGSIDPDTPFALLGLDSLAAIELTAVLEDELGFDVPPELVSECSDVRTLAARLRGSRCAPSADPFELMMADAVLPADVRPGRSGHASWVGLDRARAILVTGATGFLGPWLVRELLERSGAHLFCLVRPENPVVSGFSRTDPGFSRTDDADARLYRSLSRAGLDIESCASRIHVVEGDLRSPRLGLSEAAYAGLSGRVDAIVHAGAEVNWVHSYAALRSSNVAGTLELLRIACRNGSIPLHFVSSLSVCYSTSAPAEVDERFDALPHLRGVHLGYAQSKIVAEALVREAGARGLPVAIYRPAIISGDSRSGAFNPEDVVALLVKGCVRMGIAPDLDWALDAQPVDVVAAAIVGASTRTGGTFHLRHARPRHWRECVLWMRLYGYPIRLVPYHAWLRELERQTLPSAPSDHPLRPLRSFFLDRPPEAGGLTRPELYEEARCTGARDGWTRDVVETAGVTCPPLDAVLLDRYFDAYVASGHLPAPSRNHTPAPMAAVKGCATSPHTPSFFERVLDGHPRVVSVVPLGSGSDHSIVSELAAWRTGRPTGLFRYRLAVDRDGHRSTREVIVKVKAPDRHVIDVGEALARVCDDRIGEAYLKWGDRIGVTACHSRELAVYAQTDARFTRHAPAVLGSVEDEAAGDWILVLERVTDGLLMDAVDRPRDWTHAALDSAIRGLTALHAIWYGREAELRRKSWIGHVQSTRSMMEMSELWAALADHAAPSFSSWADPSIPSIQRRLIDGVGQWWPEMERGSRTLIHHDFNPRNICLRPSAHGLRLCAFDWELATIGLPQRDLAELLCFVLPAETASDAIDFWIERHRQLLSAETGQPIDPGAWRRGFQASVFDLLINRLATYALVHRVKHQAFLPRVVRSWRMLFQHVSR